MQFPYRKILIVGCGGAGKSTLARDMGARFSLPVVHLDKLWWLPGWQHRTEDAFDKLLLEELQKPCWIMDGNFVRTFETRLKHADLCIFLDFDAELCISSAYARAEEYHGRTRPDMAEGCPEVVRPEYEEWIRGFRLQVRPQMMEILKGSETPYLVFPTREEVQNWLIRYQ